MSLLDRSTQLTTLGLADSLVVLVPAISVCFDGENQEETKPV